VQSVRNNWRGKHDVVYDGHNRQPGAAKNGKRAKWRQWRRMIARALRKG